jgi:maleylacetate reductase
MRFALEPSPSRVVFGAGCFSQLPEEVERLGSRRVFLVGTPGRKQLLTRASDMLGPRAVGIFDAAVLHVPEAIAVRARSESAAVRADTIVAIGGGSAIGAAKAIAIETGIPIIAVPTTYSGSEVTPLWGVTQDGEKRTARDARVQPRVVLYDPELTLELPVSISGASGMNAIAHCVEALYAPDANPLTSLMAEEGIRALARSLPAIAGMPHDIDQRTTAMYGAWLAGASLGAVQMGLHHKLSHTLGGSFNLPHAETHSVLLPYTAEYNMNAASAAMSRVALALGEAPPTVTFYEEHPWPADSGPLNSMSDAVHPSQAPVALYELGRRIGTPASLADLGMSRNDLPKAADLAVERPYPNPEPVTRDGVLALLRKAFDGFPPFR